MPDGYMNLEERMAEENASSTPNAGTKRQRQRGAIQFPYVDLDDGIVTVRALLRLGGVPCDRDQLAGEMKQSLSGSFVNKTSAARMFGLIEMVSGKFQITQLGHAIVDSDQTRVTAAKADAFLRVPLYRRLYDEFRHNQLPPSPNGLEQAMVGFGVPEKQKDKARRAFENSAMQAGFFDRGKTRLIAPVTAVLCGTSQVTATADIVKAPRDEASTAAETQTASAKKPTQDRHPFIEGLFQSLPMPGTEWDVVGQARWLEAAAKIFRLMYQTNGDVEVRAKADQQQAEFDFWSRKA